MSEKMREILFRGKRKDNGKWIQGDYQHFYIENDIYVYIGGWGKEMRLVKPETVGQFTGLTDKNGKKIFEGDIIEHHAQGNIIVNRGVVVWDASEGRFAYQLRTMLPGFYMHNPETVEVIGNIHDNPELLEEAMDV